MSQFISIIRETHIFANLGKFKFFTHVKCLKNIALKFSLTISDPPPNDDNESVGEPRDGDDEASVVPRYLPIWRTASPNVVPSAVSPNRRYIPCSSRAAVIFARRWRTRYARTDREAITNYFESVRAGSCAIEFFVLSFTIIFLSTTMSAIIFRRH